MEKLFKIKERGSSTKTEIMAGITTFMTMAYILAVNPGILSGSGMDFNKVFAATAISSAIATLIMGFVANLPFALAPGMGLNAFLTYTIVLTMGYTWQFALTAVFVEGIIFLVLTFCNVREAIVNSIPTNLKKAIGAGIGLFVAFIGMQNAGIVIDSASTLVDLNPVWYKGAPAVALIGLIITGALLYFKVNGALLIGIIATTIVGIPFGVTSYAGGSYIPPTPYFCNFAFAEAFSHIGDFLTVMFIFLFVDMFDTVGTLIGCAGKSGLIKEDGTIPNCKEALFADAVGTTVGAMLGTSTVTTYVESSAGVVAGGRTGLTAVTTSVLFLLSLFLAPIFGSIPSAATAPALIIVGLFMIEPIKDVDFSDYTEGLSAFICLFFMVVTYSISNGIEFGIISYVLMKVVTGKIKEVSPMTWVVFLLFIAKIIVNAI